MNTYHISQLFILAIMCVVLGNCNGASSSQHKEKKNADSTIATGPAGYDLAKPEVSLMPDALREISGIAFSNGVSDTVYAQQDEDGSLFRFSLGNEEIHKIKFAKRSDYEDIAISRGEVLMLRSDGVVISFPLPDADESEIKNAKQSEVIVPTGEYEAMAVDQQGNLVIVCKECAHDERRVVSAYIIGRAEDGALVLSRTLTLDAGGLKAEGKKKKERFMPSCLAWHPILHEWYVISSASKELIVFDETWHAKAIYPLDAKTFTQPEGMAFDVQGNMFISNEGGDLASGNILRFDYKAGQ